MVAADLPDNFVNFLNTIDLTKDFKQLTFFNSGDDSADLRNHYLPKGYEWLYQNQLMRKKLALSL